MPSLGKGTVRPFEETDVLYPGYTYDKAFSESPLPVSELVLMGFMEETNDKIVFYDYDFDISKLK